MFNDDLQEGMQTHQLDNAEKESARAAEAGRRNNARIQPIDEEKYFEELTEEVEEIEEKQEI